MTMQPLEAPAALRPRTVGTGLTCELRTAARHRTARAQQLRAWSDEPCTAAQTLLARSLRRRAAELELGATALELRAEGLESITPEVR